MAKTKTMTDLVASAKRNVILEAMVSCNGSRRAAAVRLGMAERTFHYALHHLVSEHDLATLAKLHAWPDQAAAARAARRGA